MVIYSWVKTHSLLKWFPPQKKLRGTFEATVASKAMNEVNKEIPYEGENQ